MQLLLDYYFELFVDAKKGSNFFKGKSTNISNDDIPLAVEFLQGLADFVQRLWKSPARKSHKKFLKEAKKRIEQIYKFIEKKVQKIPSLKKLWQRSKKTAQKLEKQLEKPVKKATGKKDWVYEVSKVIVAAIAVAIFGWVIYEFWKAYQGKSEKRRERREQRRSNRSRRPRRIRDILLHTEKVIYDGLLALTDTEVLKLAVITDEKAVLPRPIQMLIDFIKEVASEAKKEMAKTVGKVLTYVVLIPLVFVVAVVISRLACQNTENPVARAYLHIIYGIYNQLKLQTPKSVEDFCESVFGG